MGQSILGKRETLNRLGRNACDLQLLEETFDAMKREHKRENTKVLLLLNALEELKRDLLTDQQNDKGDDVEDDKVSVSSKISAISNS